MNEYFKGTLVGLIGRAHHLLSVIPKGLPREFHLLEQVCRTRIEEEVTNLEDLLRNPSTRGSKFFPERLRRLRRAVRELDFIETVCIAALQRSAPSDIDLNRLVERIRCEIAYPLLPPVVTPLSQTYFQIYPEYNLLRVPLVEGSFLLHLPDIYHELGHPPLVERHDPTVKPFQQRLENVLDHAVSYFDDELRKELRRGSRSPDLYVPYLENWSRGWFRNWAVELFCDLFAALTIGPAFGWSHLHLHAMRGDDPFRVPTFEAPADHPPDGARMTIILGSLRRAGFDAQASSIERRWTDLVAISGAKPEPEYHRCFPQRLLEYVVEQGWHGVEAMGCTIARPGGGGPVYNALNSAWDEFWRDPDEFAEWERNAVDELRTS
jgi:hypothetical protein